MTTDLRTPKADFPAISDQQGSAEARHNLGLRHVEAIVVGVINRTTNTPPGSPTDGDAYIVGDTPTGDWVTHADDLAFDKSGEWEYKTPWEGLRVYCAAEDTLLEWSGTAWVALDGFQTLTDAATITWNVKDGRSSVVTLGGNRTLGNPTNLHTGRNYVLIVKQDGTGSRTITWPTTPAPLFPGGAPTLSTGANAVDIFDFFYDGTNLIQVGRALNVQT